MSDALYRAPMTPTQAVVIGRHKRFLDTIRTTAARVPINDAMEILGQQLKVANERADGLDAVLADTSRRLDEQIRKTGKLELTIACLRAENLALQKETGANLSVENIIDVVAKHFGTTREWILCEQRSPDLVIPRHIANYLACQITGLSLPKIGRVFNRDHSSIIYARNSIAAALKTDAALAETIKTLREQIRGAQ